MPVDTISSSEAPRSLGHKLYIKWSQFLTLFFCKGLIMASNPTSKPGYMITMDLVPTTGLQVAIFKLRRMLIAPRTTLRHYPWKDGFGYLLHPTIPTISKDRRLPRLALVPGRSL